MLKNSFLTPQPQQMLDFWTLCRGGDGCDERRLRAVRVDLHIGWKLDFIHRAFCIRGSFAHSNFVHTSDNEFEDYVRCTQAVEALAFLLLYRRLPLPADRHWGHGPNNFTEYLVLPR